MEENRNNGMNPNMGGMNPNMGRGVPNGMNPNMNGMGGMNPNMAGMNPAMGGMPNAGGMNPNMANPAMAGMNPNGGMNRPPVMNPNDAKKAGTPPAGAGGPTALVPVNKKSQEADKKKKKKRPSVLYNILAVFLFLLMAGGLFLGMVGTLGDHGDYPILDYFSHSEIFLPEKVENTTLTGSLVGILVDGIMNIQGYLNFGEGLAGVMNALKVLLPAVSLLVLAVTIFYGLIAMIIALFSRTNSRRALQVVATSMLVGYGGCGFMTLMFGKLDYISFALAGLGFIVCFIMAIIVNKQIGLVNALISLFSIGATAVFALPWSTMREYAIEGTELTPLVMGFVALGVLYLVFFFTCARICAKKGKIFDLVMHVLQFALIVTVFVMTLLAHLSDFKDTMFRFIMPLVCTVGAPALALVTFVLALLIIFMPKMLKKAEAKKAQKAGKAAPAKEKAAKEKKKKEKEAEEQRPMNPPMPFGAPAPAMGQQPMRPMPNQPQAQQQQQRPPMQQQPQQPMRGAPPQQQARPAGRGNDEFSRSATSFKVPFTTGGGNGKTDPATQAALEKMAREMQAMKEAQSKQRAAGTTVTVQEDSKTRAAIEQLSEQLRAMKDAQNQTANQGDAATKSAIEQLSEELRAMKDAQNKAEAERKAAEDARIAEAERKAAEAKAEAERIAKEAEAKAEQARLEAAKATEEERKKLEEERRKLEEERKAAEDARLEAERKAAEAKAEAERREAERREAEAKAEAERKAAEAKAEAERKAEEERRKIEEEKRKLEEERKAVEAAKAEAEQKRQDELEQLKRELREMKAAQNQPAPAQEPAKPEKSDDDMARIMEELRSLREAQANAGNTTVNYMADDSNKQQLSEFEKRMEDLIRSQNKEPVKREPTAFEKRMAELAARKAALQNGGASAKSGATAAPAAAAAPKPAASNEPARYDTKTFDSFFATLSTAEVNEFGDIFIADKIGVLSYMPAYVIGGDNKDFFRKIMIYLGKFRSQISQSLLEKILKYIRSPH